MKMKNINHFFILLIFFTPISTIAKDKIHVSAGTFNMGCSINDTGCDNDEGKPGGISVHVDDYFIDANEVTVAQYAKCIEKGKCKRPKDYALNNYCNFGSKERNTHPVNCVDWQQALDFCQWKNGRLPYEAEWEKAARAGSTSRYPWGEQVSCKQAIVDDGKTVGSVANEPDGCGEDRTWPVGSRQANALGLYDMHGNAGEWTANWYAKSSIEELYSKGQISSPEKGRRKVVRGGSWDENTANLRSSYRNTKPPMSGQSIYGSIGFRCAYDK